MAFLPHAVLNAILARQTCTNGPVISLAISRSAFEPLNESAAASWHIGKATEAAYPPYSRAWANVSNPTESAFASALFAGWLLGNGLVRMLPELSHGPAQRSIVVFAVWFV